MSEDKSYFCKVETTNDELGIVFGYGIISKVNGENYVDTQNDHIPEDAMVEAAADFMQNSRISDVMHDFKEDGNVVFAFPLTTEIAKSLNIETERTGLLIGMRPSKEVFEKFKKGEFTGFSIGGKRITTERADG